MKKYIFLLGVLKMPIWTDDKPPQYVGKIHREAVATDKGWEDKTTHEVYVAIPQLATKAGSANILSVLFDKAAYLEGDAAKVIVRYNEYVNLSAGASLIVNWSGVSGNITALAAAGTKLNDVLFTFTVPSEAGSLSLAAQSLIGSIVDNNDGVTASQVAIDAPTALAAGTIVVA